MANQPLTEKKQTGNQAERLARHYLEQRGLVFLHANFQCKTGEIDLIMQHESTLIFVEVRFRKETHLGSPLETITPSKQRKLIRTASFFLQQNCGNNWPACRFDAVGISGELANSPRIEWIPGAFGA